MSGTPGMTMEEAEEAEENLLLSCEDDEGPVDSTVADDVDETAEDLMTDMKLDDEMDDLRATEPDFHWTYHIEIYPWTAEDMTENFVRLLKLADFSQIYMRKKGACKENGEPESVDDKLQDRQRKGSIHFYTDNCQNAKNIIRSSTWKAMISKQLTFEITKRGPDYGSVESAYLEVDTYTACKCRYRDRPKGEFKDRSAKVSSIPGTISREFLDVIFCRAYAVIGGSTVKEYYKERNDNLELKLSRIKDFNGSLDFDCLSRGSCRAFVTSHKNVYIEGQRISIAANNEEIMTIPPSTDIAAAPPSTEEAPVKQELSEHPLESQTGVSNQTVSCIKRMLQFGSVGSSRGRGPGRILLVPQRPTNVNVTRAGPGMPVPMTGRQKMNEKLRRNQTQTSGPPVSSSNPGGSGGPSGYRHCKQQRVTFNEELDMIMLKEVFATQALLRKNGKGWRMVADNLLDNPSFPPMLTPRTVRERTNLLMTRYRAEGGLEAECFKEHAVDQQEMLVKAELLEDLWALKEGRKTVEEVRAQVDRDAETRVKEEHYSDRDDDDETCSASPSDINHAPITSTDMTVGTGVKRGADEDVFKYFEDKEKQRRKERDEEMALKRMELEMQRERQEEEMRLRRENQELAQEERRAFLNMMHIFVQKMSK